MNIVASLLYLSSSGAVFATDYTETLTGGTINLYADDTVSTESTGINSADTGTDGQGKLLIDGNPTITVTGINGTSEATGIKLSNTSTDNTLGTGTTINVTNDYGEGYGLTIDNTTSQTTGSNIAITVNTTSNARGVSITSPGSTLDLGTNSSITVSAPISNSVVWLNARDSSFAADHIAITGNSTLSTNDTSQYLISVGSAGGTVNLGTGSTLTAASTSFLGGVLLLGDLGSFAANELTLKTTNGRGIGALYGATANISNSTLEINGGEALYAEETGVFETDTGSTINVSNSTITQNNGAIGIWAYYGGIINVDNLNFTQTDGTYGLVASQGGTISLTGENNLQANNILMIASGRNSAITGSGRETLVGHLVAQNNGAINLNMTDGSYWSGAATTGNGGTGTINLAIEGDSSWYMTDDSTITSLGLTNGATVYLSSSATDSARHTLTITGDYTGNAGKFVFYGDLNGDTDSSIDQLVINGNVVLDTKQTKVSVQNIGGLGEKTIEGIKIITVTGDSPDAFVQDGRIVAGAYDYYLQQGNADGEDTNSWYLTNELSPVDPTPSVRPEAGAYLGNLYAANNMFQMSLHDRLGEVAFTENEDKNDDVWVRFDTRKVNVKTNLGGVDIGQTYNGVQFGYDFLRKEYSKGNEKSFVLAGIMGGYGDTSTTAKGTAYNAGGSLHGFSVGPYATWYRESPHKSGTYADVWALWNRFDGSTNGEGIDSESYRLQGMVLSAEVGYDQLLSKRASQNESNRFLKWQGQITYQGVDGGNKVERNGTVVDLSNRNVQTRLGVRYYSKPNGEKESYNQPYVELNWYHNTKPVEIQMDETKVELQGTDNIGEIKIGTEYKLRKSVELWGYGFYAKGGNGYSSYGARLGVKKTF